MCKAPLFFTTGLDKIFLKISITYLKITSYFSTAFPQLFKFSKIEKIKIKNSYSLHIDMLE